MPLYRRQPKLKGIAGGMKKGLPKHVTVNISKLEERFPEGGEIDLEKLKSVRLVVATGSDRKLPLKILGTGDVSKAFTIKAAAISATAKEKIEKAGGSVELITPKIKWTKQLGKEKKAEAGGKPQKQRRISRRDKKEAKKKQLQSA